MRVCSTCSHIDLSTIEAEIIRGVAMAELERRYGISDDALARHRDVCIVGLLAQSRKAATTFTAENLMARLEEVQHYTLEIFHAERRQDSGNALRALALASRNIELAAKVLGVMKNTLKVEQGESLVEILSRRRKRWAEEQPKTILEPNPEAIDLQSPVKVLSSSTE